jgi:hypothetical protein
MRGVDTDDDLRARIRTLEVELSQRTDEAAESARAQRSCGARTC